MIYEPFVATLTDAGLMAGGAELWFSFLHRERNNTYFKKAFILCNDILLIFNFRRTLAPGG